MSTGALAPVGPRVEPPWLFTHLSFPPPSPFTTTSSRQNVLLLMFMLFYGLMIDRTTFGPFVSCISPGGRRSAEGEEVMKGSADGARR